MKLSKKIYILAAMLTAAFSSQLYSQELLTLQDAIALALEQNHSIQAARNTAQISENNASLGSAGLLPKLDLSASAAYNDNDKKDMHGNPVKDAYTNNTAGLQASYTLFDGLGNIYTYKKLNSLKESGSLQARRQIENTIIQVSQAYFNTAETNGNVNLAKESLSISRERLQRAKNRSQFGQANSIELLSAEVDFNADSVSFLNAQLAFEQSKRNLNVLLNKDVEADFTVDSKVEFEKEFDLIDLQKKAVQNNASYQLYIKNVKQSEYDVNIAASGFSPRLSLNSSYGYNQTGPELDIALEDPNRSFTAGVNLSFNLFNGFQNNIQRQNAKISLKIDELLQQQALLNLKSSTANVYQSYRNSLYVLEVEKKNIESAQLNFSRTEELFALGQVTTTQFREAQLNLIRAKNSILSAQYNAKLNEMQLLQLSGELLDYKYQIK